MLLHVDAVKYKCKPTKAEIGGIKKRFTKSASIKDLTVKQIADCLTAGRTIQPGVTPFSAKSSAKGYKGTNADDFSLQTIFMDDIDNENEDASKETPEHVAAVLAEHNLKPAFMYETFNSTPEHCRFRIAVVCDEAITDRAERDRIQGALIAMFNQSDAGCINADRVFFGTDKGLIDGYTDYDAVCSKADLLALAEIYRLPEQPTQEAKAARQKISGVIPIGRRNNTLASIALSLLKKYGDDDGTANEAFLQTASKCEQPLDDKELQTIWDSALKAYREKVLPAPDYLSPPEYAAQEFAQSLVPPDYTDVGQARVFVEQYGKKIRYSAATKWLVYDGKKWVESELQAQKLAQELTDRQLIEARKMLKTARAHLDTAIEAGDDEKEKAAKEEEKAAKNFRTFVLDRRSSSRIAATLTEARPAVEVNVEDLDRDGFKLNTPAGTVDLRTGKLHPHDPQDLITKMTAVSPSLDGMDDWKDFLNRATSNDRDLEEYLQISSGMEAVGNVYREKLGLAYGRGGNGKSTYYNSKARVLGDYSGSLSAETLTVSCRKNKNPEYAELRGKRLVIAAELEEGMRLDTAAVKRISSVDYIHAEKKYKDPFQFKPSHTTVLYTNHLPKVGTNDKGTWDRLVVIPFNARFRGMQGEVLNYTEYLFEHCGGAILTWIIEGAKKFIAAKYHIEPPECVKRAIEEYYLDNDWLSAFIEECCNVSPEYEQKAGDLYDAYRTHCANKHEWARGTGDFKAALTGAGYNWRKTSAGACYYGLKLKPGFEPIIPL